MSSLEALIAQIPERHNPVSYLIFSGIVLGLILAAVILLRAPRGNRALFYYALLILCLCIVTLDTWLCYTGWMKYSLAWNDSTEPFTLLLAPLLFLCVRFLVVRRPLPTRILLLHFLPALLYAASQIEYYTAPIEIKYNAYKAAYFDYLPFASAPEGTTYGYQKIKDLQRWFLLIGFLFYGLLSFSLWRSNRPNFGNPASGVRFSKYRFGRIMLGSIFVVLALMLAVYLSYEDDGGDHFLSLMILAVAGVGSVALMSESRFFEQAWLIDKYETQTGSKGDITLDALKAVASEPSFFTSPEASLKGLANKTGCHPNTISRLINEETDGHFNDFLNGYRIELAKQRLKAEAFQHLTVEGIGQSVGFRSKSSFYQAFRKSTGMSPSQFAKNAS